MRWLTLLVLLLATVAIYGDDDVETNEAGDTEGITIDAKVEKNEEPEADWIDDGVVIITSENFETFIKENEFVLVEFYAPWCGHCKSFAPEYAKVATEMEEKSSPIKIVKVDGFNDTKFAEEYGVKGYPTVKLFRNGTPSEYWGAKLAKNIIDWLYKKTGPPALEITNIEGAEELIKSQPVVVIGFFDDRESEDAETFLSAADSIDDYRFGITSNEDVYRKYDAESGSIILFKNFDDGNAVFDDEISGKAIQEFVAVNSAPLVIDFNRHSIHSVFSFVRNQLLMFYSKKEGQMEKIIEPTTEAAKLFRGEVLFIAIDIDVVEHLRILSFLNIKTDEIPTMRLVRPIGDTNNKYKPKEIDFSPKAIASFVRNGLDGKLKVTVMSEDLPEDWDKTPVKTLVGTNFDDVAFDKTKNVFVAFYSPWSSDFKELEKTLDELGEKYKDSETVIIAKFDAISNELDPVHPKITSYPTLKLFKKGGKSVVDYTGKKSLDAFVKFIESGGEEIEPEDEESSEADDTEQNEEEAEEETEYKDELLEEKDEL